MLNKNFWASFQRIIELFTQTFVIKLFKIWVWIRVPEKTYPGSGSRGPKGTGSRIRICNIGGYRTVNNSAKKNTKNKYYQRIKYFCEVTVLCNLGNMLYRYRFINVDRTLFTAFNVSFRIFVRFFWHSLLDSVPGKYILVTVDILSPVYLFVGIFRILGRTEKNLVECAAEIKARGGNPITVQMDHGLDSGE
jgi:hypothetical protein